MSSDEDMGGVDLIAAFKKGSQLPEAKSPAWTAPKRTQKPGSPSPAVFSNSDDDSSVIEHNAAPARTAPVRTAPARTAPAQTAPSRIAPARTAPKQSQKSSRRRQSSSSDDESVVIEHDAAPARPQQPTERRAVAVAIRPKPTQELADFIYWEPKDEVARIVREATRRGDLVYEVAMSNGKKKQVDFDELLDLDGGAEALQDFQQKASSDGGDSEMSSAEEAPTRRGLRHEPKKNRADGMVNITNLDLSDEDSSAKPRRGRKGRHRRSTTRPLLRKLDGETTENDSDEDAAPRRRRGRKPKIQKPVRRTGRQRGRPRAQGEEGEEESDNGDSSIDILRSDLLPHRKRKRRGGDHGDEYRQKIPRTGVRQSDRTTRAHGNMQERDIGDIYRSGSEPRQATAPKIVSVREVFETLPRSNLFRSRHVEGCEVCGEGPTIAPLIYCQGCCLSYHKNCLGNRATRDHLVTKVGHENFVLQCKRCINFYKRKDRTAPDLSKCQDCNRPGPACRQFRHRKTTVQEQKDRDDNGGQDPIVDVPENLINNASNVLFRCTRCARAYHYHHLPPLSQYSMSIDRDEDETADERFQEYSRKWLCKECDDAQKEKVSGLIAWRPSDLETYRPGTTCEELSEDDKQYLIKWEKQSYFRASWHSGAWTWGVTAPAMRKAFFKRGNGPKMRTEDAIPEEFLRIDIVLDVKYTSVVEIRSEEIDKARIKEVDTALIKYKGLGYEDAVWEKVPTPEDGDRWLDFVTAYNDWVAGRYIRYPKQGPLKARLDKARGTEFAKLEKEKQPENLVGGELMKYQIEGLNWIYWQWYNQKNGILADEMGLGKTIQVIGFMATMVQEHNCFPFLVVVPNATCANWRREIKQWAPSLRVVTYFGSATARDMAYKYEMYPQGGKEIRCHVVVTSYEAATDDSCRKVFRGVSWAGLIVDEGQRLKNDKSQLYGALNAVKAPFRLLLTGTPLQNNARELFNLLQFLDDTINAAELEEKYAEMTSENIRELHDQIRPFILRRTKAQVLTFLPPLGQIIVPLSMSVLQKSLYKSILAKNPELLKALFMTNKSLQKQERASLSNILMQLRKCLCHPFVYSREIEERTDVASISHRNLVEASAKLQLLELLLPKLQERGHRVLIFSQFLDMLNIMEDFLDGMQMAYQRLDGSMGSLEKQKRIDQFNAPDSPLFAFLLSTRAGGVGINLATADTVIILDPDFNPHQDIQAISRAHRIGQKKKVLCFQLMTRASAEEKIVQIGRKKMALDHVVVEQLDAEDMEDKDVESILKHGASELFKDDSADHDIRYDEASIEKLLDRSQIENTKSVDNSAESQFSFARVWANDQGALEDGLDAADEEEEEAPDPGVWEKILKERQALAAAEALARAEALGRGKRARGEIKYNTEVDQDGTGEALDIEITPVKKVDKRKKRTRHDSDTDFQESDSSDNKSEAEQKAEAVPEDPTDLEPKDRSRSENAQRDMYKQNNSGAPSFPPSVPASTSAPRDMLGASMDAFASNLGGARIAHAPAQPVPPLQPPPPSQPPRPIHRPSTTTSHPFRSTAINSTIPPRPPPPAPKPTKPHTTFTPWSPARTTTAIPLPSTTKTAKPSTSTKPAPTKPKTTPVIDLTADSVCAVFGPGIAAPNTTAVKPFKRTTLPVRSALDIDASDYYSQPYILKTCSACRTEHPPGACALKLADVEHCNLCGLAHFGQGRTCPHIRSETQVREMLEALRMSAEKKEHVDAAMKYLKGVKGHLVQDKKRRRERAERERSGFPPLQVPGAALSLGYAQSYGQPQGQGQARAYDQQSQGQEQVVQRSTGYGTSQAQGAGSYQGQRQSQGQQRTQQQQGQKGPVSGSGGGAEGQFDESAVENALRGFLGH